MNHRNVRIVAQHLLSDNWYILKKIDFELQRRDGSWQALTREVYDRGNGATIGLYNLAKRTVILIRQFRIPTFVNGHDGYLIEKESADKAAVKVILQENTDRKVAYEMIARKNNQKVDDVAKNMAYSGVAGLEYKLSHTLFADVRYTYGFANVFDDYVPFEAKNRNIQIGVGYKF